MNKLILLSILFAIVLGGCMSTALPPVKFNMPNRQISYLEEVKPILDKRCVVCHSCYNSPCQLKLSSYEGLDRGATKEEIYNAGRLHTMDPSRLFTDAQTTEEWRKKGFNSVTESNLPEGYNDSIMLQLINHKMKNPKSVGDYYSEGSEGQDLTCSENKNELGGFLKKHPNRGMPFGFPPLKQEEFDIVAGWIVQGARGPTPEQQKTLVTPKTADAKAIQKWEAFLNKDDPKHRITARYLYEHLFLAHIYFGTLTNEYYEVVRSKSAPGTPIDLIATVRPYEDPGVDRVYYRFRKIHSTIVYKTHILFTFDDAQLKRFNELFIVPEWLQMPHLVGYDPIMSANPFVAFEQIPPRSRYQFLLDNSQYIISTFIRGPVCKGQIALDVVNDHFWTMFIDPDHDLSVQYPGFLKLHSNKLIMPTEAGSEASIYSALQNKHHKAAVEYYKVRQEYYMSHNYGGLDYDAIWKGNRPLDAPLLTVYRHFDSASVQKGAQGNLPKTMWVLDYPLLERIYYALVAGFDIYGTAGHQLSVRLYMDALRVEGESYFLDFMPLELRQGMMQSWYKGVDIERIAYTPAAMPSGISYLTDDPKREFIEHVISKEILPVTGIGFDSVNYLHAGEEYPPLPKSFKTRDDYIQGFRAESKPGMPFFAHLDDWQANVLYVRIRVDQGEDAVISIVINRWHDNVAFLVGEEETLDVTKDNVDFIKGFIGSYPNYFIDIHQKDLPDFFELMSKNKLSPEEIVRFEGYGVNRANDNFWEVSDWFHKRFADDRPVTSGLFDLNRYYHKAEEIPLQSVEDH